MKNLLSCAALILLALPGRADEASEVAAERARIAALREQVQATFTAEHQACYQKFAVNDCIDAARAKQRQALAELRRRDAALNDLERKRKAADRVRDLEARAADQRRQEAERAASAASQPARAERGASQPQAAALTQPAQERGTPAPGGKPRAAREPQPPRQLPTSENVRAYEQRQEEARQHRARVEKKTAEHRKAPNPLPTPP